MTYEVVEKEFTAQPALVVRETVTMKTVGEGLDAGFRAVREHAASSGADVTGPPCVFSPDFGKDSFDLMVCLPVAEGASGGGGVTVEELPGGRHASVTHVGPYPQVPDAYSAIFAWLGERDLKPAGPPREIYHNNAGEVPESEQCVEIAIPLP